MYVEATDRHGLCKMMNYNINDQTFSAQCYDDYMQCKHGLNATNERFEGDRQLFNGAPESITPYHSDKCYLDDDNGSYSFNYYKPLKFDCPAGRYNIKNSILIFIKYIYIIYFIYLFI